MVKSIATKAEFDDVLKNAGDKLVAVDFTATWCGPCQRIGPKFVEMAATYTDVVFIKVDVDENAETAEHCGIEAMPTFKFYKNSKEIDELVGASEEQLKAKIEANK
jgi:thioredoxin 1